MVSSNTSSAVPALRTPLRTLLPNSALLRLGCAWGVSIAFLLGGTAWLAEPLDPVVAIVCFLVLFGTILYAAFGVVHEVDHLVQALGEPYGTLILTLAVVLIEVILIAAVMTGPGESPTIGRDSIFAVMMIIMNLVMGLCLLLGGLRYGEQEYNTQGAVSYLSMILLLSVTAFVLPTFSSSGNGSFLPVQAVVVGLLTIVLYGVFLFMQMHGYRRFFVQPQDGAMEILPTTSHMGEARDDALDTRKVDRREVMVRSLVLVFLMLPIILLANDMAILIDLGVERVGAPVAVSGVLIAIIVFTPESLTAVSAALHNQMQRVINLCLGAFVSTIGLTVPAVLFIGLLSGKTVTLGLDSVDAVLALLTIALSTLSLFGARTSPIQGLMHLMLFAVYGLMLFVP